MKRSKTYLKCLALSAVFASSALALSTPAAYAQTTSQVVTDIGQNAKHIRAIIHLIMIKLII